MADYLRSVLVQDVIPPSDGVYSYDLPVNPLSHIVLTIKCLNNLAEATLAQVLSMIPKLEVVYRGTGIYSLAAADLYVLNCLLLGYSPILTNRVATDNATRSLSLIVPFGRKLYNTEECFPATKKGEFQLQLTADVAVTNADGLILQVETVELFDASPSRHLKIGTLTQTPTATGDNDLDLPIGNVFLGILLWGTTFPSGVSWVATIEQAKFLVDNDEVMYSKANWESLRANLWTRCGYLGDRSAAAGNDELVQYALLDFDPTKDDAYALDTAGKSSVKIRYVAGDTNPIRALPIELISLR